MHHPHLIILLTSDMIIASLVSSIEDEIYFCDILFLPTIPVSLVCARIHVLEKACSLSICGRIMSCAKANAECILVSWSRNVTKNRYSNINTCCFPAHFALCTHTHSLTHTKLRSRDLQCKWPFARSPPPDSDLMPRQEEDSFSAVCSHCESAVIAHTQ